MEIGNDLMSSLRQRLGFVPAGSDEGQPEWASLLARLSASHAARRALSEHVSGAVGGDFTQWQRGGAVPALGQQRDVNPTNLRDGKAPQHMIGLHAGSAVAGG